MTPAGGDAAAVDLKRSHYQIDSMDCPTEEAFIRNKLMALPGVINLEFNLMRCSLTVQRRLPSPVPIEQTLAAIGMRAVHADESPTGQSTVLTIHQMDYPTEGTLIHGKPVGMVSVSDMQLNPIQRTLAVQHAANVLSQALAAVRPPGFDTKMRGRSAIVPLPEQDAVPTKWWPLAIAGANAVLAEVVCWLNDGNHWAVVILALATTLTGGLSIYKKGWIALKNHNPNMNVLMSIAATGAMVTGHQSEAAMVVVLFTLVEIIEAHSLDRTRDAIRGLMDLVPETATVQRSDGSWSNVDTETVAVGSHVRVRPGEHIVLNGTILQGRLSVNQAPITGENPPVEKAAGDSIFVSTINESGLSKYRAIAAASDSILARIIYAVEAAQGSQAPAQHLVDQFVRLYAPIVLAAAPAVAIVPPLVFGMTWLDWIYKALALPVIACPCAFMISTPVSIVSGLAAAAKRGTLIKDGIYLEEERKLKWLVLDKTDTITHGKPAQTDVVAWGGADMSAIQILTASLATRSDYPVSLAVARAAQGQSLTPRDVADLTTLPGYDARGHVNGMFYHLGNHRSAEELGMCSPALEAQLTMLEIQGKTVVMLIGQDDVRTLFDVTGTIKDSSRRMVKELHVLGIKTLMLSDDNPCIAEAIAQRADIGEARGSLLSEDKQRETERRSV